MGHSPSTLDLNHNKLVRLKQIFDSSADVLTLYTLIWCALKDFTHLLRNFSSIMKCSTLNNIRTPERKMWTRTIYDNTDQRPAPGSISCRTCGVSSERRRAAACGDSSSSRPQSAAGSSNCSHTIAFYCTNKTLLLYKHHFHLYALN